MEKQPISTAPLDGTEVLILADDQWIQARFDPSDHCWENGRFGLGFGGQYGATPTHWMPRPATATGEA